jgi:NTP pyrophosphatase (non-canonical NTP hydrolase)
MKFVKFKYLGCLGCGFTTSLQEGTPQDEKTKCADCGKELQQLLLLLQPPMCSPLPKLQQSSFNLSQFQQENAEWAGRNFGEAPPWQPLLGVVEEVGELSHHFLKSAQGIRGTEEKHKEQMKDGVGDVVIYLAHFCSLMGFDLEDIVETTWNAVKKRDWKKDPDKGVNATGAIQDRK